MGYVGTRAFVVGCFIALASVFAQAASTELMLDNDRSSLAFTTTKNGTVTEVHNFGQLAGRVTKDGSAAVEIDLVSVATGIDLRDERMREFLFKTSEFGKAVFSANVSDILMSVKKSSSKTFEITGKLSLHGTEQTVTANVLVTRGKKMWVISTAKPILIKADDFDLGPGVEKLRELAKLTTISKIVPVSFVLTFTE
jgi:polyisoprenoid-binding protein YceI